MTFLELVRAVRSRVGMQGSGPTGVTTATTAEMDLVNAVSDAWIDLQLFRNEEWRWMRNTTSFNMVAGTNTYTESTIFPVNSRLSYWRKDTCYAMVNGKKIPVYPIEYDTFIYRTNNDTSTRYPYIFTVRPWDNALLFNTPNDTYTIYIDYQKTPQQLVANGDIPELPTRFHLAIVYAAVEKYDAIIGTTSYDQYAQQHAIILGQIMRNQLDKKTVITRGIV